MATHPQRIMPSLLSYGANVTPAGQVIPGTAIQLDGVIPCAGQPPGLPQQNPPVGVLQKMLRVETKTLGAIQIMIGLIHITFGAVALTCKSYLCLAAVGGYPFWGGLFFIISGSLSVSVENQLSRPLLGTQTQSPALPFGWSLGSSYFQLMKSSVGLNITSAVMAFTGVLLYISELIINSTGYPYDSGYPYYDNSVGIGLGVLLLFFSLLEFCIAVSTAHFGCQVTCPTCCKNEPVMVFVPYTVSTGMAGVEGNLAPPSYEDVSPK